MLGSILIGLDSPKHGAALVELGIRWGGPFGATLVGLGIVDEPGIRATEPLKSVGGNPGTDPVYYMGYHARMADIERQVDQRLKQFAARCTEAGMAHTEVHVSGSPAEVIEREAQSCDLIVLARGATFRFTPQDDENDETLKKVLKIGTRPVVLVPESRSVGPVVIAYDGSHESIRALAAFQATGLGDQSPVHVMTVDSGGGDSVRHNERARQFLRYHKIEANSLMIESSHEPATVILEQLSLMGAGMLVMGACGQTRMREFLFGSVTRRMLAECPVPLFLFH